MSSRGSYIKNGHVTTEEYYSEKEVHGAKVLVGRTKASHGLPDYSHSPSRIYIKENKDGSFRELRIYDDKGYPVLEVGYHPEPSLTHGSTKSILHMHKFGEGLIRYPADFIDDDTYKTLKGILEAYGL